MNMEARLGSERFLKATSLSAGVDGVLAELWSGGCVDFCVAGWRPSGFWGFRPWWRAVM